MLRKLFVVMFASVLFVGCGTGTNDENDQTPNDTPMDDNEEINEELPGDTDNNLNREQIDEDMLPEEENITPDGNNNQR